MMGHAAHRDAAAVGVFRSRRERQVERAGADEGVFVKHLVEVAHPEQDDGVAVLLLGVEVLTHRGRRRRCHMLKVYRMRVLALDSTTRAGSVALVDDCRVVDERSGDGSRTHAERLPHELVALADAHGVALADIDLYAVAAGPGSFTGLRIGIATVQGLAFVHRRRVVGIPALDALAYAAAADEAAGTLIAAWMDAHRRDVFSALYRVGDGAPFGAGRLERVDDASVGDPASILARWRDRSSSPRIVVGDGATAFSAEI